jgi:hypothetical protein
VKSEQVNGKGNKAERKERERDRATNYEREREYWVEMVLAWVKNDR